MILHGLRKILGSSVVDYPRKKVLYKDFSESPQEALHGKGFTLYTQAIEDVPSRELGEYSAVLYGVTNAYGVTDFPELNKLAPQVYFLDGHDNEIIQKKPCFKREMFKEEAGVFPTGFGIPSYQIRKIDLSIKKQLFQKTAPKACFDDEHREFNRTHYIFNTEEEYYRDMAESWFGLTCKKGGWDSLRHYEIIASGACLIFKRYNDKPALCSPQKLPVFTYNTNEELLELMDKLVPDGKPTKLYKEMLFAQRDWLLKFGTCEARALSVIRTIQHFS
jgi:hypothetical protein